MSESRASRYAFSRCSSSRVSAQRVRFSLRQPQLALHLREAQETLDAEGDHAPIEGALDQVGDSRVQGQADVAAARAERDDRHRAPVLAAQGQAHGPQTLGAEARVREDDVRAALLQQRERARRIVGRGHLEAGAREPAAGLLAARSVEPDEQHPATRGLACLARLGVDRERQCV